MWLLRSYQPSIVHITQFPGEAETVIITYRYTDRGDYVTDLNKA